MDNEAKGKAIQDFINQGYVPAKKHSDEVKKLKADISAKQTEFDTYKQSKMTEEEKQAETIRNNNLRASKLIAENIFAKAGYSEEIYNDIVTQIVGENLDVTEQLANAICNTMKKQADDYKTKLEADIIKNTPKPTGGNTKTGSEGENKLAEYQTALEDAKKKNDIIGVARYTRLIQTMKK